MAALVHNSKRKSPEKDRHCVLKYAKCSGSTISWDGCPAHQYHSDFIENCSKTCRAGRKQSSCMLLTSPVEYICMEMPSNSVETISSKISTNITSPLLKELRKASTNRGISVPRNYFRQMTSDHEKHRTPFSCEEKASLAGKKQLWKWMGRGTARVSTIRGMHLPSHPVSEEGRRLGRPKTCPSVFAQGAATLSATELAPNAIHSHP